jgi:NSS family neurotransmitter:Na+ symporter
MPQLFSKMALGSVLAVLFFLGLSFAAFTSLISMIELAVRVVVDYGASRQRAIMLVGLVGFAFGIPSAMDLNILSNQDFVWGVGLIISGAFIAFAIIRSGATRFREEAIDNSPYDWRAGRKWQLLITVAVPVQAVSLLVWWLYQSAAVYAPTTWYDPFEPFSVMTCLVQWGVAMLVLGMLNNRLATRSLRNVSVFE